MQTKYNCKITPEELKDKIDKLIEYCEGSNEYPDSYLLLTRVGISAENEDDYFNYKDLKIPSGASEAEIKVIEKKKALSAEIMRLRAFREHMSSRLVLTNPKLLSWEAFRVKQTRYGGWKDKDLADNNIPQININLDGVGGIEAGK